MLGLWVVLAIQSCHKYKDPAAVSDPRLNNPYCNDPNAVNYNWGFPGKPDNTVCFYPTDLFHGVYELRDSVTFKKTGFFISCDTFLITITRQSSTKMSVSGFCGSGNSIIMTAGLLYNATVDTLIGDTTTTMKGQALCSLADTVNGTFTKDRLNDSFIYINLTVSSDTGVISSHIGTAKLKYK